MTLAAAGLWTASAAIGCSPRDAAPRDPEAARSARADAPAASGALPAPPATAVAGDLTATPTESTAAGNPSATSAAGAPRPPARAPGELPGRTIDFPYDAKDVNDATRAYVGRAFVHDAAVGERGALPLIVFLHGLNRALIPHRWMGGGTEGDVRRLVANLVDARAIPPVIVAGPGSIQKAAVSGGASFPTFDFDRFVELTEAALEGVARVDRARIVVLGHSGAGCSDKGGIVAAVRGKTRPLAVMSIDTCMTGALARALAAAAPATHVVVTWQTASWARDFDHFRSVFKKGLGGKPPNPGVLRELDPLPALPRAHDATVGQTLEKWLPRVLPPA